jgi:putative glutamine amidotransferase
VDARGPARLVDGIDALLLIGGADIDPATYGAEREPGTEKTYRERDDFELAMVRHAIDRELPVLGVCRGMQILNIAFGGTLVQDLAGPDGSNIHRRQLGGFEDAENHVALDEGSLAAEAAGEGLHIAHCHHHQAIDRLGDGLVITGRAVEDGLAEALEAADDRWVLGVQWHPESRDESAILASFVTEARDRAAEHAG